MKLQNTFIIFLTLLISIATVSAEGRRIVDRTIRSSGDELSCVISDVDDGDTVDLLCGEKIIPSVRLLGINTPDVIMPENIKHCYYSEARSVMRNVASEGRELKATFYGSDLCADRAKGCRNLVRLTDTLTGYDINERLIEMWYAFQWTEFSMVPPAIKARYRRAERLARKNDTWLWWSCEIVYRESSENSSIPTRMTW